MTGAPVRVMLVVNSLGFGGAEKHIVTLANRLDAERFRCSVVYLKPPETLLGQLAADRLEAVIALKVSRRIDIVAARTLAGHLERLAIDVVICANEYPTLLVSLAVARMQRRPGLIEVFHTTVFATLKERLQMWLYRMLIRRFDLLTFVSLKQQEYWQAKGLRARRTITIHNGIDCEYFEDTYSHADKASLRSRYGFGADDYLLGICAALRPEKAHGDLLQAVAQLRARGVAVRCMIIGDGPERVGIERTVSRLGLDGQVAITGFQSDVRPFIACCDIMLLVSHAIETFSIAALEAMALGKPMVMSRIGGAEELVRDGENGLLFEAGRIDQLVAHIQCLASASVRATMSAAARQRVREAFTESGMISRYTEQLLQVACGHSADRPRVSNGLG